MKKQIFSCFVIVVLSITAISASKPRQVNIKAGNYVVLTDTTIPNHMGHDSGMHHRNRRDTSMNHTSDTTNRRMRDSTIH